MTRNVLMRWWLDWIEVTGKSPAVYFISMETHAAYVVIAYFIVHYETPPKIVHQVYLSLLKTNQTCMERAHWTRMCQV